MSLANLAREAHFATPENFYLFSVFNNPLFKSGKRSLIRSSFDKDHKLSTVADFYKTDGSVYSLEELNNTFNLTLTQLQHGRILNAITSGLASLNINLGQCTWHAAPRQSIIIQIATQNKKGCRAFYRTFRARQNLRTDTTKIEEKWHLQLNSNLSITYWDNAWKLHASIKDNNQLKWIQCQILRNCIYTNNRVSKFKNWISDQCDFCGLHVENSLTLFHSCNFSQKFWAEVKYYLLDFTHTLPLSRLQILFGIHDESFDSISNTAILLGKRVIWASKHKKILPTLQHFKKSLKDYLVLLCYCHRIKNTSQIFHDQWGDIFRVLASQDGTQLPPEDD